VAGSILVVDPDRQVVFGFFMFNHRGDVLWVNSPGEGKHDMMGAAKRPFSVDVGEAFRIKDGKILKVEALMTALPYGAKSPSMPQEQVPVTDVRVQKSALQNCVRIN
jgi:hypothetical protein